MLYCSKQLNILCYEEKSKCERVPQRALIGCKRVYEAALKMVLEQIG